MGRPRYPDNVKLFMGILYRSEAVCVRAESILEKKFGVIELRDSVREFHHTSYYKKEMGAPLYRYFLAFQDLISPDNLPRVKLFTNAVEDDFREEDGRGGRMINLDPGYMSHGSVILATTKNYSHRVYLQAGIYAEPTYRILGKQWEPFEWTYPDYKARETLEFFANLREVYLKQRRDNLSGRKNQRQLDF